MDEHLPAELTPAPSITRAKHESGAVAREEDLLPTRPDGTRRRILTGDRTTGRLHIGHWVGSLKNRVRLQEIYDTFILMADVQALTTHYDRPEVLRESVRNVALDYLAAGIDPEKATIVVQSQVPAIDALTVYYGLLVPVRSLVDNPTVKAEAEAYGFGLDTGAKDAHDAALVELTMLEGGKEGLLNGLLEEYSELGDVSPELFDHALAEVLHSGGKDLLQHIAGYFNQQKDELYYNYYQAFRREVRAKLIATKRQRGFTSLTYGFLGYPISQAADITFVDADLVPVGPDQVPLIELCREVVHRFNSQYCQGIEVLREPQALLGTTELIRGIDGSAKMSKSQNNAIYLSDTDEQLWSLLRPAPTDPQRVRKTDPGRPEMCNIYAYHTVFNGAKEPSIDEAALGVASVEEVAYNCSHAAWGCIDCKNNLRVKLNALLDPMRQRRTEWSAREDDVIDILKLGTRRAQEEGEKTLARVRSAMHMDYFDPAGGWVQPEAEAGNSQ
jgi:tryptophanyl-tRNA synthetase